MVRPPVRACHWRTLIYVYSSSLSLVHPSECPVIHRLREARADHDLVTHSCCLFTVTRKCTCLCRCLLRSPLSDSLHFCFAFRPTTLLFFCENKTFCMWQSCLRQFYQNGTISNYQCFSATDRLTLLHLSDFWISEQVSIQELGYKWKHRWFRRLSSIWIWVATVQ